MEKKALFIICILFIIFPFSVKASTYNEADLLGLTALKKETAYYGKTGRQIKIAVIDTGVYQGHNIFANRITNPYNVYYNNNKTDDYSGHGTAVASIIAYSTPSNVKIMPISLYGRSGEDSGSNGDYKAFRYAIDHEADIITYSFVNKVNNSVKSKISPLIQEAVRKGIPVVVSSGNYSGSVMNYYPASDPNALTVQYVYSTGSGKFVSPGTGAYGDRISFAAPGKKIAVANKASSGFVRKSGTSFAVPFIASELAYVKLAFPDYSVGQMRIILKKYCTHPAFYTKAYCGDGVPVLKKMYADLFGCPATKIQSLKKGKSFVKVSLSNNQLYSGYQIKYKTAGKTRTLKIKNRTKKIALGRKWKSVKIQVRAYRKVSGKTYYSKWTGWKTVRR